jgi:hypothetical protein
MKTIALWISFIFFLVVLLGILRTILEGSRPFIKKFDKESQPAYIVLIIAAVALLSWSRLNLHIESLEIAGVKASVGELKQKVATLSDQMEVFFKDKRIEVFNSKNWDRVRKISKTKAGVILEVTLQQAPIPGSVEVYEGVLLMPEQKYKIDGRKVQFPANTDTSVDGLTIKYYPRLPEPQP